MDYHHKFACLCNGFAVKIINNEMLGLRVKTANVCFGDFPELKTLLSKTTGVAL